jgi:hypothetical protein
MQQSFIQHGKDADIKSARSENQSSKSNSQVQSKITKTPNAKEGQENEPSHSEGR